MNLEKRNLQLCDEMLSILELAELGTLRIEEFLEVEMSLVENRERLCV